MKLSDYFKASAQTERFERKIFMAQGRSYSAEMILKTENFKVLYADRKVTSVYFDDASYNSLRDNIDGNQDRDKIRFRFYNAEYQGAKIEIKHKRSYLGYKTVIEIEQVINNLGELIAFAQKWCDLNLNRKYFPTGIVSYQRSYFVHGKIRATIDRDVQCSRMYGQEILSNLLRTFEVVEFKYDKLFDPEFRLIYRKFSRIAARTTKSSKYSNSMMEW